MLSALPSLARCGNIWQMRSDGSLVGDILDDVLVAVLVLAVLGVLAPAHEVEEAGNVGVHLLLVRVAAALRRKLAVADRVEDAGLAPQVVAELALVPLGAVVLVVELAADLLGGLGAHQLPLDGVGEEAVEAVLAVPHVEVDAGVEAALHVRLLALVGRAALVDCEELVGAEVLDHLQLRFQALVLEELLVVHQLIISARGQPALINRQVITRTSESMIQMGMAGRAWKGRDGGGGVMGKDDGSLQSSNGRGQ